MKALRLLFCIFIGGGTALAGQTNNIMITGYWPPTNEMLRQFSTNPAQNGGAWNGANWEGRGFNVYSYFPEFPGGTGVNPWGNGDFEVDYQDTAADWATLTAQIKPVAIITFSRANSNFEWELEPAGQRFRLPGESNPPGRSIPQYTSDGRDVLYPSNVPIAAEPVGTIRNSTLPMQQIVDNVKAVFPSTSVLDPHIAPYDPGNPNAYDFGGSYLSGYIGYLGEWYHDEHAAAGTPFRNFAAGHIHVGRNTNLSVAVQATEISLRTLIDHITPLLPHTGDANIDGAVNLNDFNILAGHFGMSGAVWEDADFNYDGMVNLNDFNLLAGNFGFNAGPDGPSPQDWATLASMVPEPFLAAPILLGLSLLRRRRRLHQ